MDEIERKFVVPKRYHQTFLSRTPEISLVQGYLNRSPATVRVTLKRTSHSLPQEIGLIAFKGAPREGGLVRSEFEYKIPFEDAKRMLNEFEHDRVEKVRHLINIPGDSSNGHCWHVWEVDVVEVGPNQHLVLAEIEKPTVEEVMSAPLPVWVGEEVTGEKTFTMSQISKPGGLAYAYAFAYRNE